jgi:asparagine synthase (glutamine-hydrolysing)
VREQQQGGNTARAIWGLMQLAIWHRIFIDGRVPGRDEDPLAWIA